MNELDRVVKIKSARMVLDSTAWVYIMGNQFLPGLLKIGHTTKHPYERARSLSAHSGIPAPFDVLCAARFIAGQVVEKLAHKELDRARVSPCREFFDCSIEDAKYAIWLAEQDVIHALDGGAFHQAAKTFPGFLSGEIGNMEPQCLQHITDEVA